MYTTSNMLKLRVDNVQNAIDGLNDVIKNITINDLIIFLSDDDNRICRNALNVSNVSLYNFIDKFKERCSDINIRHACYYNIETRTLYYLYAQIQRSFNLMFLESRAEELYDLLDAFYKDYYKHDHIHERRENLGISIVFADLVDYCKRLASHNSLKRIILSFGDTSCKDHVDKLIKSLDENKIYSKLQFIDDGGEIINFEYSDYMHITKIEILMNYAYDKSNFLGIKYKLLDTGNLT